MFSQAPAIYSFSEAPAHILFHLAVALCSVLLGAIVLFRRKGNFSHRVLGRAWVLLMFATAISSFFIQARGTFSAIHLLSVTVLISMSYAIFAIRSKRVRGASHRDDLFLRQFVRCRRIHVAAVPDAGATGLPVMKQRLAPSTPGPGPLKMDSLPAPQPIISPVGASR
jgi:uncharacterized membrane protein